MTLQASTDARSRLVHITDAGRDKRAEAQRHWKAAQLALNETLGVERVLALTRTGGRLARFAGGAACGRLGMTNNATPQACSQLPRRWPLWLVLLAAAGTFGDDDGHAPDHGPCSCPRSTPPPVWASAASAWRLRLASCGWRLTQPFAGAVADRIGTGRSFLLGVALVALGTFITPYMTTTAGLIFAIGVLAAGGAGMAGPSVLMAAARLVPLQKRGLGQRHRQRGWLVRPVRDGAIAISLTAAVGWASALQWLGVLVLLALPAVWVLRGNSSALAAQAAAASGQKALTAREAIAQALATPSYRYLAAGFLVCGFHVAFWLRTCPA